MENNMSSFVPDIRHAPDLKGKRVLLRAALDVPLVEGAVAGSDYRLDTALPTLRFLSERGARTILIGHIGRDTSETLRPVFDYLKKKIPLSFAGAVVGPVAEKAAAALPDGGILLFENLRREAGETDNDTAFASALASYADIYVNDAFSVSHRSHASITGVPAFVPSYAGVQFAREVEELSKTLTPPSPSLVVIGGAKFETKQPFAKKCLERFDKVFIGGALANDFFKAKGWNTGISLVSDTPPDLSGILGHPHTMLPVDVVVEDTACSKKEGKKERCMSVKKPDALGDADYIFDAGPETTALLTHAVGESRFVLWNGPLGEYEHGFGGATEALAKTLISSGVQSVVGGGDTVSAIAALHPEDGISFVSTAGGAMFEFFLEGTLPGIEALKQSAKKFGLE